MVLLNLLCQLHRIIPVGISSLILCICIIIMHCRLFLLCTYSALFGNSNIWFYWWRRSSLCSRFCSCWWRRSRPCSRFSSCWWRRSRPCSRFCSYWWRKSNHGCLRIFCWWRNPDHALDSAVIGLAAQCGNTNLGWPKWGILISALDLGGRFRPRQADSGVQGKGLGHLYIISAFLQLFHSMQVRDYLLIYIFIFFALPIISRLVSAKPPIFNNS